jgi:hypothetical protein
VAAHTIVGNNTGSTAVPVGLNSAQATAELDLFAATTKGLAPACSGGACGTVDFLREDGTWATPPGAAAPSFSVITGGTNTSAAMLVGTGASLAPTGTGTVTASKGTPAFIFGDNTTGTQTITHDLPLTGQDITSTITNTGFADTVPAGGNISHSMSGSGATATEWAAINTGSGDAQSRYTAGGTSYVIGNDQSVPGFAMSAASGTLGGVADFLRATPSGAVTFPDSDGVTIQGPLTCNGTTSGCVTGLLASNDNTTVQTAVGRLEFPSGQLVVSAPSTGVARVALNGNVNMSGPTAGDVSDEVIFFPGGTTHQTCGGGNQGRRRVLADGTLEWCGDNTSTTVYSMPGPQIQVVGGLGTTPFTYAGEVATPVSCNTADTGCARTVCRCGICTGTEGSGTCTLPLTSMLGPMVSDAGLYAPQSDSAVYEFSGVAITAGTVTVAVPGGFAKEGITLAFRVAGDFSITGTGAIDMKGRGQPFTNPFGLGDCTGAAFSAGNGANSMFLPPGLGGPATGADTAGTGFAASLVGFLPTPYLGLHRRLFGFPGGSHGNNSAGAPMAGLATGGGGGGCTASCATGKTGLGGTGGGFVYVEARGVYTCTSTATRAMDLRGNDGGGGATGCSGSPCQSGGGGGGGGALVVLSKTLGTNTCTVATTAGVGGIAQSAACGDGAAGGNGAAYVRQVPG